MSLMGMNALWNFSLCNRMLNQSFGAKYCVHYFITVNFSYPSLEEPPPLQPPPADHEEVEAFQELGSFNGSIAELEGITKEVSIEPIANGVPGPKVSVSTGVLPVAVKTIPQVCVLYY